MRTQSASARRRGVVPTCVVGVPLCADVELRGGGGGETDVRRGDGDVAVEGTAADVPKQRVEVLRGGRGRVEGEVAMHGGSKKPHEKYVR